MATTGAGANASPAVRVLRLLASEGVFAETAATRAALAQLVALDWAPFFLSGGSPGVYPV